MPTPAPPGIYTEETSVAPAPIERLARDAALFVGSLPDEAGDALLGPFTDPAGFEQACGPVDATAPDPLRRAAAAFFANGGRRLHVAPVATGTGGEADAQAFSAALQASLVQDDIGVVAAPGASLLADREAIEDTLLAHVGTPGRWRFLVLDPPPGLDPGGVRAWRARLDSAHAATYYPWIIADAMPQPPSGFLCGVYAAVDAQQGTHRAPANVALNGATGFERFLDKNENEVLNPLGINCLRRFPGRGLRAWGARTLSRDPDWKYVNVRRLLDQLQLSLDRGLAWTAFEPQAESLWTRVRAQAGDFLFRQWREGALMGNRPDEAWFVRCDRTTMTEADIEAGRLVCEIGVAVVKPAEFIVFRLALATAAAME